MASSTSSIHKSFKYDVFLSFRGEDTRTNFVDHLYHALQQKNMHTYKDDPRIKKGKNISDELIGAIEDSKFYIIVFSKNYASSSWCLDELVKIMECHRTTEHTAYPVFYDVEPSEVRKQKGAVATAFAEHEKEGAAGKWRDALTYAAELAGWELKKTADGHEAILIQKIVEELSLEVRAISFNTDEKLVGMESRIKEIVSSLGSGFDDVRMIGIKGMGGGGKTTLARAVFDQISFQFQGKSFVENVREASDASFSGLKLLQKQVLSDVLNDKDINVSSVYDGKHMMKRMMPNTKVLVVLDDVKHIDQLEALAGEPNWFKGGSRIIVTTRDEQVLVAHGMKFIHFIHDVTLLSGREAICLFSRYAFGKEIPIQGYEELSGQAVNYAAGLPLTIRVLGSFLCGKNELEWIDAIERLKTIPLTETLKKLELSFTSLEDDYKEIFLDIACILKGWQKDLAIKVLESRGFRARNGLRVLEQKSLITTNKSFRYEYVDMHDHIQELGRNIVRRSHPDKPHKHSRLWIADEIDEILTNDLGTKATRCIQFYSRKLNPLIVLKGLRSMKELKFLSLDFDPYLRDLDFDNIAIPDIPNSLQYLILDHYPFKCLPGTFHANNLVTLKMAGSRIVRLWEGGEKKALNKLKLLDLTSPMLSTLDLGLAPCLEELNLYGCRDLAELRMSTGCLKLISVKITDSGLKTLDLGLAPNLEELYFYECRDLVQVRMSTGFLKLISLKITYSRLWILDLGLAPNLETLYLYKCHCLLEVCMSTRCLKLVSVNITDSRLRNLDLMLAPNLETLNLYECRYLVDIHMADKYEKLKSVNITCSRLRTLDLGLFPNLESIYLVECRELVELCMATGCIELKSVNITDSRLRTLDLGLAPNLEVLILYECRDLVELRMSSERLKLLSIDISRLRTLDLGLARNLELLNLYDCRDLVKLHMSTECFKLVSVNITHSTLRTLDFGLAPNLETLNLVHCIYLEELRMAHEYQKLANLNVSHSKLRTLNLGLTPNLKMLHLDRCSNLVKLYTPTGCLKHLVYLDVSGCLGFYNFSVILDDNTYCGLDESFEVGPLAELHLISKSVESCPLHLDNTLPKFQFSCYYHYGERPSNTRNLELLISLGMCACIDLATFSDCISGLRRLRKLRLEGNTLLFLKDLAQLDSLEELTLTSTTIKHLPDSICTLKHLKFLELDGCMLLESLPGDLGQLECLEKLHVSYSKIKHLPDSICMLKHLKSLKLRFCCFLKKLPEDLGRLECLEDLTLSSTMIRHLPDSICMLKHLKTLELISCSLLQKLPKDFGSLTCLKELNIECTSISRLAQSILYLKDVHIIGLRGLVQSCGLTSEIPTPECETSYIRIHGNGMIMRISERESQFTNNYCNRTNGGLHLSSYDSLTTSSAQGELATSSSSEGETSSISETAAIFARVDVIKEPIPVLPTAPYTT